MIRKKLHTKGYLCEFLDGVDDLVHRRVWKSVYGSIPEGCVIHHKNGDKLDNRVENLECMTARQHTLHHHGVFERDGVPSKACKSCGGVYPVEVLGVRKDGRIKSYCGQCAARMTRAYRERVKGSPLRKYRSESAPTTSPV